MYKCIYILLSLTLNRVPSVAIYIYIIFNLDRRKISNNFLYHFFFFKRQRPRYDCCVRSTNLVDPHNSTTTRYYNIYCIILYGPSVLYVSVY